MMQGDFARVLARYGQDVTVYTDDTPSGKKVKAFFQPMREKGMVQAIPSPLGTVKRGRFLYIGPPDTGLTCDGVCRVEVGTEVYRPRTVRPVYVGNRLSHWWAVFGYMEREVL